MATKSTERAGTARPLMPAEKPRKLCVYARISLDKKDDAIGVERQIEASLEYVARLRAEHPDWSFDRERHLFVDNNVSGYTGKKRDDYDRMLAAIKHREVDGIVCWHPDRISRNEDEQDALKKLYRHHDVRVFGIATGTLDYSTPAGRLQAAVFGMFATYETELKNERVKFWHKQRAMQGKPHSSGPSYGHDDPRCTIVNEHEASVLNEALRRVVLDGETLTSVIRSLNARGERTKEGREFQYTNFRDLLLSPRLVAMREYEGELIPAGPDSGWKPVVDVALWRRFREMATVKRTRGPKTAGALLLAGLVYENVGTAEEPKIGRPSTRNTKNGVAYYGGAQVEATRYRQGESSCGFSVMAADLDDLVTLVLFDRLRTTPVRLDDPSASDRARLEGEMERLRIELAELQRMKDERRIDFTTWASMAESLTDEKRRAEHELALLEPQGNDDLVAIARNPKLAEEWPTLPFEVQRRIVRWAIKRVYVQPAPVAPGKQRPGGPGARLRNHPERVTIDLVDGRAMGAASNARAAA